MSPHITLHEYHTVDTVHCPLTYHMVTIGHKAVTSRAFRLLLEYIYTGQVKVDIRDMEDLNKLAKYCKMEFLSTELEDAYKKADSWG